MRNRVQKMMKKSKGLLPSYGHNDAVSPSFARILQETVCRRILIGNGTNIGNKVLEHNQGELNENSEPVDLAGEERWLGEKDSNPHSQNQNPPKPKCDSE